MTFEEAFFKTIGDRYDLDALAEHLEKNRDEAGCVWRPMGLIAIESDTCDMADSVLWACLVGMFGTWMDSMRDGWINRPDEALLWLGLWRERAGRHDG